MITGAAAAAGTTADSTTGTAEPDEPTVAAASGAGVVGNSIPGNVGISGAGESAGSDDHVGITDDDDGSSEPIASPDAPLLAEPLLAEPLLAELLSASSGRVSGR